ncbi:MAG TPA: hypothetical protein V6D12_15460 [Candidatus Obscuribacterales bacterium]
MGRDSATTPKIKDPRTRTRSPSLNTCLFIAPLPEPGNQPHLSAHALPPGGIHSLIGHPPAPPRPLTHRVPRQPGCPSPPGAYPSSVTLMSVNPETLLP